MEKNQLIRQILNENNLSNLIFDAIFKKELLFPLIDLLIEQKERHSEFNFEKILLIALLLSKKVKKLQIITNLIVLSFTATVIWHSVLNRPGNREYLIQEELDLKFERSISAVRYLRQELGISNKTYYSLENFIDELENATSLKEQKAINYHDVDLDKYETVKNFISKVIIKRKKARSAIECSTFLYFTNDKAYTKNEIWYAIENRFFNLEGTTPRASFGSDISRHCDNSVVGNKRKPLLFTILNLNEKAHRIQLILEIRNKIDDFLRSPEYGNNTKVSTIPLRKITTESRSQKWRCPKYSCNNEEVEIERNWQGVIYSSVYKKIIIHFLQHLKKENIFFSALHIYQIFIENTPEGILSERELELYSPDGYRSKIWKVRVNAALADLTKKKMLETWLKRQIFKIYNLDLKQNNIYGSRKRTEKFLEDYHIYDDWELYKIERTSPITKQNNYKKQIMDDLEPYNISPRQDRYKKQTWVCPKDSCRNEEIKITRNNDNIIDGKTYQKIIIHFLQHLKRNNEYFGSIDIYSIFHDNTEENIFSEHDLSTYPDYGRGSTSIKWKNQVRSVLNHMTKNGYFETVDRSLVPAHYNLDITDKRKFRTRKRTKKFFKKYEIYDDWELYNIDVLTNDKKRIGDTEFDYRFDDFWNEIYLNFVPPVSIFTLGQGKQNIIVKVKNSVIFVKTEKGTKVVSKRLIKQAWINLNKDGILRLSEHEKSTYRSSFILALFAEFDFIEINEGKNLSISLKDGAKIDRTYSPKIPKEIPIKSSFIQDNQTIFKYLIQKLKYLSDSHESFMVSDLMKVNVNSNQSVTLDFIEKFLKLLENPFLNGVKKIAPDKYQLKGKLDEIITKFKEISNKMEENIVSDDYGKNQDLGREVEIIKFEPLTLILHQNSSLIIKKNIEYFIPEISPYLSYMTDERKRNFFMSEVYQWRRKFQIMNIDEDKIERYYKQLQTLSMEKNFQLFDVSLILNLNENKLYYIDGGGNFDDWKDIPFSLFQIIQLDESSFKTLLERYRINI